MELLATWVSDENGHMAWTHKNSTTAGIFLKPFSSVLCPALYLPTGPQGYQKAVRQRLSCHCWAPACVLEVSQAAAQVVLRGSGDEHRIPLITSWWLLAEQNARTSTPRSGSALQDSGKTTNRFEHPEPGPKAQADCPTQPSQGIGVSPSPGLGSQLPGSWRSSTAPPWPLRSLDSQGACRSSWNEVAPRNCGRSCRCDCRQCWEAEKLEAQWQLAFTGPVSNSLILVLGSNTWNNF